MSQAELPRQAVSLPGLSVSRRAGSGLTAALRLCGKTDLILEMQRRKSLPSVNCT